MKRVLSIVLLLALCIGCFAGCAPKEETPATATALEAAKEYLYAMYKDSDAKTAVTYTVVSQIIIEDKTFPITWTTDAPAENVKVTAGENKLTTIEVTAGEADVNYKLTATLKDEDGTEASVSFDFYIPKAEGKATALTDGTYVILAGNLTMSSLSADKSYGYPTATEVTVANGEVSGHVAADVLTIKAVEGGYTIQDAQGRYFYLKGTYNSFNVDAAMPAEGHIFSILAKDGKYLIQNTLAMKTLAYSTSYSSWGCYPELTDDHTSAVDIIAVTAPSGDTTTPDNNSGNTGDTGNTGNTGNTGTTTTVPSSAVLYYAGEKQYVTGKADIYVSSSGNQKYQLIMSATKADAVALTIKTNADKTISFVAEGKYLSADGTHVKFVASQDDNTKFVLESAGETGKYFVKCAVANYGGKAQYLEVYKGNLTCYGMGTDPSIYTFELQDTTGANGKLTEATPPASGDNNSDSNSGSNTGSTTVTGNLAASIDLTGTTTRTSYSTSQIIHAANGITYTNDKASSTNNFYDMTGKTYATRAYKGSTVKVEYTGMTAIVFHLDDYNNGDYTKGFDNMTVSGATISRDGATVTITFASATNAFQSTDLGSQIRIKSIDVYTA